MDQPASRRRFLRYLAASPLFAGSDLLAQEQRLPDPMVWAPRNLDKLIDTPREALSVFDFEPVMHKNVPPAHFGYMATGIDDEVTLRANREGFQKFQLAAAAAGRRLAARPQRWNCSARTYGSPIVLAPTGSNKAFHEDGELAVARAAQGRQPPADPLDRGDDLDRAGDRGARPARLVPALSDQQVGGGRGPGASAPRRPVRRPSSSRSTCWRDRTGRPLAAVAHRQAQLRGVPWLELASFVKRKPNFDGLDLSGINTPAPPTSPGRSSSACATR